jgi:tetratricopeptide (TPR) repeat protein
LNDAFGEEYGVRLLNHIGVNTGEVIATGDASTAQRLVTGDAVNTAARLEQAAGAAEIILGELTHRLTRNEIQVDVIPPLVLKGKAEPVPAYRFVALGAGADDGGGAATQFVGREAEMARLSEALFGAIGRRRARLITIVGDAGVGKSRLIREFASTASHEAGLVRGRCLPYGDGITFWPLAEIVRDAASIASDDSPPVAIEKIRALVADPNVADERDAVTDRVASMLGLSDAQFSVAELMWGMRRVLETLASERPLVMIVDDIHSAAQTFLDFIDYLLEAVDGAAIMLVCSARHELLERFGEWSADHAGETIVLAPLTEGEVGTLVGELLGSLEGTVRERIATAAEGNPLYAEQIVSMLQETGAIRREGDRWVSTRASGELAIPPTVHALVAARLDALGQDERAVIEPASVVGLSFAEEAVAELVEADVRARLEQQLGSLAAKQLVRRASGDEILYRFGHLVIKDTAYGSLLKRVRVALHERFVVWAERVNRERGRETEFEEILGFHLEQAYRYRTELGVIDDEARATGARAAEKLGSAGRRALARGDLPAAVNLLHRASGLLVREAPFRLEVLADLAEALLQQGTFDGATETLSEIREIATETGSDVWLVRASLGQALVDTFRGVGEARRALEAAAEAIAVLEPLGDAAGLARAWRLRMIVDVLQGHLEAAGRDAERVIEYARQAGDARLASRSAGTIAYVLLHGPTPVREAVPQCEELVASVSGDRSAEAVLVGTLAVLRAMEGSFDEARALYRRGQTIAAELGAGLSSDSSSIDSSRVELLAGDAAAAEHELRRDYEALAAIDETYFRSTIAANLAKVLWLAGDADGALHFSEIAEQIGDADDVLTQVPWRSARAMVLAARGDVDGARRLATEAVDLAAATPQTHLRAEALVDLAEVLEALGDHESSGPPLREALTLFDQKGDVVSAGRLRARASAGRVP